MRYLAYFTIPTLAGWVVGSLTCILTTSLLLSDWPNSRDILNEFGLAGLLIIAPTFFLCILPYCGISLHSLRTSKIRSRCKFYALPLFLCLVVFGAFITFFPALMLFGHNPSLRSPLPPDNPILWFIPFVPYAAVVAFFARALFGAIQNRDN